MQELKKSEVTIVRVPEYVTYECPYCGEEVEIDYDKFFYDMRRDCWPKWVGDSVICYECGAEFIIESVEVD